MKIPKLIADWLDIDEISEKTLVGHSLEDELLKRACDLIIMEAQFLRNSIPDRKNWTDTDGIQYKEKLMTLFASVHKVLNVQAEVFHDGDEVICIEDWIVKQEDLQPLPNDTNQICGAGVLSEILNETGDLIISDELTAKTPFKVEAEKEES